MRKSERTPLAHLPQRVREQENIRVLTPVVYTLPPTYRESLPPPHPRRLKPRWWKRKLRSAPYQRKDINHPSGAVPTCDLPELVGAVTMKRVRNRNGSPSPTASRLLVRDHNRLRPPHATTNGVARTVGRYIHGENVRIVNAL